jgi:hypothetical protein
MEEGSTIIVGSNGHGIVNIDLETCIFESCYKMWHGIVLEKETILKAYNDCIFRDADNAIRSKAESYFYLNRCSFVDNIIGISSSLDEGEVEGNFYIHDCVFKFAGPLKGRFFPQKPNPFYQHPFGTHPKAGIYMANRHGIIGSNQANKNTFFDLNNGIVLLNSAMRIYNASFESIHSDGFFLDDYMGSAIYANDNPSPTSNTINELYVDGINFFGGISYPLVTMKDCYYGIYSDNAQSIINTCKMENMGYGVFTKGLINLKKSWIGKCYIEAKYCGIDYLLNPGALSLVATKNTIYTTHSKAKCIKAEETVWGNTLLDITENQLFDMGKGGIEVAFFKYSIVKDNNITAYGTLNPDFSGITMKNCNHASVACNNIMGGGKNAANTNNHGIHFIATSESNMDCNTVDNTTKGVGFYGSCGSTYMRDNKMWNHNIGLFVHSTGVTEPHHYKGNQWNGTFTATDYGARNDNFIAAMSTLVDFTVDNNGQPQYLPSLDPSTPANWFQNIPGQNYSCTQDICDPKKNQSLQNPSLAVELAIADGSYVTTEFTAESIDLAKQFLYTKLDKDAALRAQYPSFQSFYAAHQNTSIANLHNADASIESITQYNAYFTTVIKTADSLISLLNDSLQQLDSLKNLTSSNDSLLDSAFVNIRTQINTVQNLIQQAFTLRESQITTQVNTAIAENALIQSAKLVEQNEKQINSVYLETVAQKNYVLNTTQAVSVLAVAEQCPYSGGSAVYRARVLYQLVDKEKEYNDFATCIAQGYLRKAKTETKEEEQLTNEDIKFGLAPNPSKDAVSVYYESINNQALSIEIRNSTGKIINEMLLPADKTVYSINTSNYANGVYYVKIATLSSQSRILKLVIVK